MLANRGKNPNLAAMRTGLTLAALLLTASTPAWAVVHHPPAAKPAAKAAATPAAGKPAELGVFQDWTAAKGIEGGQAVCYAFTRASRSVPEIKGRGEVMLTIAERATARDAVSLSPGFAVAAKATLNVAVDQTALDFYAAGQSLFARDGHAAALAFQRGREVTARLPGPGGRIVVDNFSLAGFSRAYEAIVKACPAK